MTPIVRLFELGKVSHRGSRRSRRRNLSKPHRYERLQTEVLLFWLPLLVDRVAHLKICVIGTGYVGLVTGACLAEKGNDVYCVDIDSQRIEGLTRGELPFFEPHLEDLVIGNTREGRLHFTQDLDFSLKGTSIVLLAVGTPSDAEGNADLSATLAVCEKIAEHCTGDLVVAVKSTVPVGTARRLQNYFDQATLHRVRVCSNPEFLKQGHAVNDFLQPDRIVVGADDEATFDKVRQMYQPFLHSGSPIVPMDSVSAELTKYVANAFLATKISFINEMSRICEDLGGDVERVKVGVSIDRRIGAQFFNPGIGFGGSCLPKDLRALVFLSKSRKLRTPLIEASLENNELQRQRFVERVLGVFGENSAGRKVGVWGLSFKPGTDDVRDAPSLYVIGRFLQAGFEVQVFDPKATLPQGEFEIERSSGRLLQVDRALDACRGAHALLLITEWNEFRRPNWEEVKEAMLFPLLADARNLYDPAQMAERGFTYLSVGR